MADSEQRAPGRDPVDYRATSSRPAWDAVPAAVRADVESALGLASVAAPTSMGFTGAFAGMATRHDGSRVFVKTGGPEGSHVARALVQEATVLGALPRLGIAPALVDHGVVDGWSWLAVEALPGEAPGMPWRPEQVTAVEQLCRRIASVRLGGLDLEVPRWTHTLLGDPATARMVRQLEHSPPPLPAALGSWDGQAADIAALARESADLAGEDLLHSDFRPDNLLWHAGSAIAVDWNWVSRGPAWFDWVELWPLMVWHGIPLGDLWATPLLDGVDRIDVARALAVVLAYFLSSYDQPPHPGCLPELRTHQRHLVRLHLGLLRELTRG